MMKSFGRQKTNEGMESDDDDGGRSLIIESLIAYIYTGISETIQSRISDIARERIASAELTCDSDIELQLIKDIATRPAVNTNKLHAQYSRTMPVVRQNRPIEMNEAGFEAQSSFIRLSRCQETRVVLLVFLCASSRWIGRHW